MKYEFKTIIKWDDGWYIAFCDEIPGANGQGQTVDEALESMYEAIELVPDEASRK